jgi:hypothetical protein
VAASQSWHFVARTLEASNRATRARWRRRRRDRLWLALVAVPLAEQATGLLNIWWAWPVLVFVAWVLTPSCRSSWVLSLELGIVGVMWSEVGIAALTDLPDDRFIVGTAWAFFPLALASAGIAMRNRASEL